MLTLNGLFQQTANTIQKNPQFVHNIWKALMQVMSETLATGKGVSMKGFISITSVRTSNRDPRSGLKHHVFLMAHNFCRSYGLTYRKPGMCLLAPCIEVNTSKLVVMTGYSKHDIQSTLKALVTKIGEVCGGGDHLKIPFERLGILLCEKRHVSFKLERIKAVGMMHKSEVGAGENVSEITSWVDKFIKSKEEEKAEARRVEERKLREETQRLIDKEMAAMAAMRKLDAPDSNTICSKDLEQQSNNNPTPRAVSRNHTPVPIRNKELQRIEELMMSKRFQDTDYVTEKNKLEHAMVNSVFPKFLIPDQNRYVHTESYRVKKNMELSYKRLKGELRQTKKFQVAQNEAIKKVGDDAFENYLNKKKNEVAKRAELTQSLHVQAEFNRERMRLNEQEDRVICKPDLNNFKAYPMAKAINLSEEFEMKRNMRESLELQVMQREKKDVGGKEEQLERERFILGSLKMDLKKERLAKIEDKLKGQSKMSSDWDKQIAVRDAMATVHL